MVSIPGYSVSGEIGRGGMAVVYRARQVLLDREVALKVLNPTLAQDPVYAQRFLQEARMLAALGHPHIVPVYDVGVTPEGAHYFSMQLLTGGDFGRRLREGIDEVELVRVLLAVAQALGFAHSRGYVHRDVTPANILFDERKRPVLTDFGIARALATTSRITQTGLSVGTSHYMSPEQARGHEVDRRSDIYSLGVLLYEALVGAPPFDGADGFAVAYAHVHEPVPRLPEGLERWQPLVDGAMAKLPDERFPDCAAFVDALRQAAPAEFAQVLKKEGVALTPMVTARPAAAAAPAAPAVQGKAGTRAAPPPPAAAARVARNELPAEPPSRMPLFLAGAAIVVGLGLLAGFWWMQREPAGIAARSAPAAAAPAASRPAPPAAPATVAATAASSDAPAPAEPRDADVADTLVETDEAGGIAGETAIDPGQLATVEDPVLRLLAMGRANVAAQRLSSPPGSNALERFRTVLLFEPRNAEALAGLASVARAYVDLAARQDPDAALDTWLDHLARAETIAKEHGAAAELEAVAAARKAQVDAWLARGAAAIRDWRRDEAVELHQRAARVMPDSKAVRDGLALAEQVGKRGFRFRDGEDAAVPSMVVLDGFALAQHETTVAQFRAYWNDAGRARFGSTLPSCRDRESFFRSSRSRTWERPGFEQDAQHPVVCVSHGMAEDYAKWLSTRTGKRYRLPTAAEWRKAAGSPAVGDCRANLRDAEFRKQFGGRDGLACSDGFAATAPVARFAATNAGLYDVHGNAREWVSDCDAGGCKERLALGAAWSSAPGEANAPAFAADAAYNTIGFRVLRELE